MRIYSAFLAGTLLAASILAKPGLAEEGVSLDEVSAQSLYRIEGTFDVEAQRAQVWQVLSGYNELQGVVSSMKYSHIEKNDAQGLLVKQVATGHFFIFSKDIQLLLQIKEEPQSLISFKDISQASFPVYEGSWVLEDIEAGVRVHYLLDVSSGAMAPEFLEKSLFKDGAKTLLQQLKAEILRRVAEKKKALP